MKWSGSFIPTLKESPQEAEAVSHRLMIRAGLVRLLTSGVYSYLPLGLRALRKVENIIREEMDREGARELLLPALQPAELWKSTGRFETLGQDMISFKDRHGKLNVLGPTHEEVITDLIRGEIKSYRQLPLILYQIQTKFRDEARPRFGVVRSREFIMKDAYSFDADEGSLSESYEKMLSAYQRIFARCGLSTWMVEADPGVMGGSRSHEFIVPAESGESLVGRCDSCQKAWPLPEEPNEEGQKAGNCPQCKKEGTIRRGLEVGHIFQLGTKYTKALDATYLDDAGNRKPILMGCYGIGVSRILAAVIEEHHDADGIRWPDSVAPFSVAILSLLSDPPSQEAADALYREAEGKGWDALWDDRQERPGVKFKDADLIGIPFQVIIGKGAVNEGKFEIKRRRDGKTAVVSRAEIFETLASLRSEEEKQVSSVAEEDWIGRIQEMVTDLLEERGTELVEFTFRREGRKPVLRLLVDRPGGITLHDCAELNRIISERLDEENWIQESYLLEVNSPGLDRPLVTERDFKRAIGEPVRLFFKKPLAGRMEVEGVLEGVEGETVSLRLDNHETESYSLKDLLKGIRVIQF